MIILQVFFAYCFVLSLGGLLGTLLCFRLFYKAVRNPDTVDVWFRTLDNSNDEELRLVWRRAVLRHVPPCPLCSSDWPPNIPPTANCRD